MAVRKKQPPPIRKILVDVLRAARLQGAHFENARDDAWLPTTEAQVNKFIAERTANWRETKMIRPLEAALAAIDQGE